MRLRHSFALWIMPVPPSPGGLKASGRYCLRISVRVFSSRLSRYLSEAMCLGSGISMLAAPPATFMFSNTSSIHRSTHRNTNGAPESKMRPAPTESRIFCAVASSVLPSTLAELTATTSADVRLLTNSNAATASRRASRCSLSLAWALALRESNIAARFLKASPKRSPERFRASMPELTASTAAFQSSRSAAASQAVFASSACWKNTSTNCSWTTTVGTGAVPLNFFQPLEGTASDSVGAPYSGFFFRPSSQPCFTAPVLGLVCGSRVILRSAPWSMCS
mmetsp:Transcript_75695/g.201115  ORF Transcript_75695/g.201115 Transcript_75695/m.201115 type:complete len:279 (+) Transcript_75695:385-1221(+)